MNELQKGKNPISGPHDESTPPGETTPDFGIKPRGEGTTNQVGRNHHSVYTDGESSEGEKSLRSNSSEDDSTETAEEEDSDADSDEHDASEGSSSAGDEEGEEDSDDE